MEIDAYIQSLWIMLVPVCSVFLVGSVLLGNVAAIFRLKIGRDHFLCLSPLFGTGAIILICQNLLYMGVRIPLSATLIWCVTLLLAIRLCVGIREKPISIPYDLLAAGLVIYLLHGLGILTVGANNYYGYSFEDMYNYVSMAQFFIDLPFSDQSRGVDYLATAQKFKNDRIGQSILHAFFTFSANARNTQVTFGATIVLAPMLTFYSLYLLSKSLRVQRWVGLISAAICSIAPAFVSIHLEGFLSMALAMPFVFIWPLAVARLYVMPTTKWIITSGLLLAVIAAVYPETLTLLLLSSLAPLILYQLVAIHPAFVKRRFSSYCGIKRLVFALAATLVVAMLANVGNIGTVIGTLRYLTTSDLDFFYPWAFQFDGLTRLWVGHAVSETLSAQQIYGYFSLIVVISAVLFSISRLYFRPSVPLVAACTLCFFPLAPLLLSLQSASQYGYQFYKLLLFFWPLILFISITSIMGFLTFYGQLKLAWLTVLSILLFAGTSTATLLLDATRPSTTADAGRGGSYLLMDENFKRLRVYLDSTVDEPFYMWWRPDGELYNGAFRATWISYLYRQRMAFNPYNFGMRGGAWKDLPVASIETPSVGISSEEYPIENRSLVGTKESDTAPFWVYKFSNAREVELVDKLSRGLFRQVTLFVTEQVQPDQFYPLWVSGMQGAATLITINFAEFVTTIRFDQWGYPTTSLVFDSNCAGAQLDIGIFINEMNNILSVECNGEFASAHAPRIDRHLLTQADSLGVNGVTDALEGTYYLAPTFPGSISDITFLGDAQ